ncbi:MAG: PAS/PAC domain-containing protein [Rhodanobacteraceae bacterium]|jgi:diguanylate cyclase (GGDEF)-like protein/PAS domain S-box-containing protein|nr:MAG: PAS/PAC domain-containing protein [Rhodanobacteraceae bacterium]
MLPEPITKLIIAEDQAEDAEQIISVLRNSGIALRPQRISTEEELAASLESFTPDLVLANPDCKEITLAAIGRALDATGKDVALLALADKLTDDAVATILTHRNVRGIALRNRHDQLQAVVRRELDSLNTRRNVRRLEAALRESERRCDALLDSSRDPIAYIHEGTHVRANNAYLEMFGFESFEDVEGLTILDLIAPQHTADFKDLLKRLARGEKPPSRLDLTAQRGDGSTFEAVMEFSPATYEGEPCQQIVFRLPATSTETEKELHRLKTRDPLTGLYNRTHFLETVDEAVARAIDGATDQALLLLEPDNYRAVIDTVGITGADDVLRQLAGTIKQRLGESDRAGRIGDHSFGILLSGHAQADVQQIAESLRASVETAIIEAGGHSTSLTISIGGSLLGEKNAKSQVLLSLADDALRAAAGQGGNRIDIHDPAAADKAEAARQQQWLDMIDAALEQDGFLLYYQPVINLQGEEGEFYEVLLRMRGPTEEVMPAHFMPIAERNDRLLAIDRWVIEHAIKALGERGGEARPTTLFIKLSTLTLHDETLADWVDAKLAAANVKASQLVFEVPEAKVMTCLKPAREFVDRWRKSGGGFELEQFGSGLNSFQALKHIDADYLKIDRALTTDLAHHPDNEQKVRELCSQARAAGKRVVVEWIEEASSMPTLFSAGVNFAQGNFLATAAAEMHAVT